MLSPFTWLTACGIPPVVNPSAGIFQDVDVPVPLSLTENYLNYLQAHHPNWDINFSGLENAPSSQENSSSVRMLVLTPHLKHNVSTRFSPYCDDWFWVTAGFNATCNPALNIDMGNPNDPNISYYMDPLEDIFYLLIYPFAWSPVLVPDPEETKEIKKEIQKEFQSNFVERAFNNIPQKERERLSKGRLLLGKLSYPIPDYMTSLSNQDVPGIESFLLNKDIHFLAGEKPVPPSPPTPPDAPELTQNTYESTADFNERVTKAKALYKDQIRSYYREDKKYKKALAQYQKALFTRRQKMLEYPLWRKNAIREMALNADYGNPSVSLTQYDPDAQVFSMNIESTMPQSSFFVLPQKISNGDAPAFEMNLKNSQPTLHFVLAGDQLLMKKATFRIAGRQYTAFPSDKEFEVKRSTIHLVPLNIPLEALSTPDEDSAQIPSLSDLRIVRVSSNPEIQKLLKEIRKKEAQKSDQSEISVLKQQLALLQDQQYSNIKYDSPVDHPSFKLSEHSSWYAVVVGVERYPNGIPPAEFSDRDAQAVKTNLIALGYPESHIRMLTNDQATDARIKATLKQWLPRNVPKGGRVLFYFAGHGGMDATSKTAYLVPFDGDPEDLADTALSVGEAEREIGELPLSQGIIVADACFSGAGGRSVLAKGARPLITVLRTPYKTPYRNLTVFGASRGNQISGELPKEGHGIFTYYFLRGLEGQAKTGNAVTPVSMKRYLSRTVPMAFRHHYNSGEQNPVVSGDMGGVLVKY